MSDETLFHELGMQCNVFIPLLILYRFFTASFRKFQRASIKATFEVLPFMLLLCLMCKISVIFSFTMFPFCGGNLTVFWHQFNRSIPPSRSPPPISIHLHLHVFFSVVAPILEASQTTCKFATVDIGCEGGCCASWMIIGCIHILE